MIYLLLLIFFIANLRRNILLTYWWQTKEYRLDRFWVFLRTKEGKDKLEFFPFLGKLLILSFSLMISSLSWIFAAILLWEVYKLFENISSHQLKRPNITSRAMILLLSMTIYNLIVFYYLSQEFSFTNLILADILSYLIIIVALELTGIISKITLHKEKTAAVKLLQQYQPKIIAITGSYGKSSTKHLVYHLLSGYYPTIETPANHNTPFGVARAINKLLTKKIKYFICEMGAYKKGEINALCQIAKPDFAVICGIAPQHIALFGSMDNIIQAKYEIAQNLTKKGVLFLNTSRSSTEPIEEKARQDNIKMITYALSQTNHFLPADYSAIITAINEDSAIIKLKTPTKYWEFKTNMRNLALIENLVGALSICLTLKLNPEYLKKAVSNLQPLENATKTYDLSPSFTIIDDSYNSNPIGFESALNTLQKDKRYRVVITDGVLELGHEYQRIHQDLAKNMEGIDLILTTSASLEDIFKNILKQKDSNVRLIKSDISIIELKGLIKTPTSILLEGRLPSQLMKTIKELK